jgi:hypothetical protein
METQQEAACANVFDWLDGDGDGDLTDTELVNRGLVPAGCFAD